MPDWIDALQARGLLTGTQARELRTLRPEGARQMPPRPQSSFSMPGPVAPPPPPAEPELFACVPCGRVYTGTSALPCPKCGAPLRAVRPAGPLIAGPRKGEIAPSPATPPAKKFGRYLLKREIGRGGMGVVHEAWDSGLQRAVAIKTLSATSDELDAEAVERFKREARSAAKLRHPAIVGVLDVGFKEGRHFIAMEYIEGDSLHEKIYAENAATDFPLESRIAALGRIASALAAAHAEGVVHRDVKPSNILIDRSGKAYLSDFGLARDVSGKKFGTLTVTGSLIGTLEFMSPEQAEPAGAAAGPAADVFSFGVVAYLALTGEMPCPDHTTPALAALSGQSFRRPSEVNPNLPPGLDALLLRCLEADPARRPRDGRELVSAFVTKSPAAAGLPMPRPATIMAASFLAAVVVTGIFAAGIAIGRSGSSSDPSAPAIRKPPAEEPAGISHPRESASPEPLLAELRPLLPAARAASSLAARRAAAAPALALADRILAAFPEAAEAHALRGEALEILGRAGDAEAAWSEALRHDPARASAAFSLGWSLLMRGRDADLCLASEPLPPAVPTDAGDLLARAALPAAGLSAGDRACAQAAVALLRGDRDAALRLAGEAARAEGPGWWRGHWLHGALLQGDSAAAAFATADAARPETPRVLACLAAAQSRAGRDPEAFATAERALRLDAALAPALQTRAVLFLRAGKPADARRDLDAALAADPDFAPARLERALLTLESRPAEAAADLDRAAALRPKFAPAFHHRGRARAKLGDFGSAVADFDAALALDDRFLAARVARAAALDRLGRLADAARDLDLIVAAAPGDEAAHASRIDLLTRMERGEEAIAAATEAVKACPNSPDLRLTRAVLLTARQSLPGALSEASAVIALAPDSVPARLLRLQLRARLEKWTEALEDAAWLLEKNPDDLTALFWKGYTHVGLREYPAARKCYERIVEVGPEESWQRREAEKFLKASGDGQK